MINGKYTAGVSVLGESLCMHYTRVLCLLIYEFVHRRRHVSNNNNNNIVWISVKVLSTSCKAASLILHIII